MTEQVIENMRGFVEGFVETLKPVMQQMRVVYEAVYETYIQDGAIYGSNSDGMLRWLQERAEAERLINEAKEIIERQNMLRRINEADKT